MASNPSYKAQENATGYIKPGDIRVRPEFPSNADLAISICGALNSYIKGPLDHESRRILHPNLLVFRPSGRAGDEFEDQVSKELTAGDKTYLIIASSTKPTDMFHIREDDLKKLQDLQTRIVINAGRLVTSSENHYDHNSRSLKKLAEDICEKYKVRMRPVSRKLSVRCILLGSMVVITLFIMILHKLKKCFSNVYMHLAYCITNVLQFPWEVYEHYVNV